MTNFWEASWIWGVVSSGSLITMGILPLPFAEGGRGSAREGLSDLVAGFSMEGVGGLSDDLSTCLSVGFSGFGIGGVGVGVAGLEVEMIAGSAALAC